jgi:hypothetical protein
VEGLPTSGANGLPATPPQGLDMHRPPPRMQHLHSLMKLNTWGDVCLNAHQTPAGNAAWCGGCPHRPLRLAPPHLGLLPNTSRPLATQPQQLHLLNNWCSVPLFSSSWIASLDLRLLPMHLSSLTYRASWTRPLRLQMPASCLLAMTLQVLASYCGRRRRSKFFFSRGRLEIITSSRFLWTRRVLHRQGYGQRTGRLYCRFILSEKLPPCGRD